MPFLFSDTDLNHELTKIKLPDELIPNFEQVLDATYVLFNVFGDINGVIKYGEIRLKVPIDKFEVVLKAELIEMIVSFNKGVPAFRASRTSIEVLARVFLLLHENSLIMTEGKLRSDKLVGKIESAATSKSASALTSTFLTVSEGYGLGEIASMLKSLYSQLNDYTHGNPNLDYQVAISEFSLSALGKLKTNLAIVYQMTMLYAYLLIFIGQKVLGGRILSRQSFAFLERSNFVSKELLDRIR